MDTVKIDTRDVNFWYGDFHALKGISMQIEEKSVVAFIGPSGCGKSTFLRLFNRMNDLIPATRLEGEIRIDGHNIYAKGVEVDELRKNVGMVFQHFNLFPNMTVLKNITLAPVRLGKWNVAEADQKARALLKRVGLEEKADVYPGKLSGGQKQLISFARTLLSDPKILVLDEATSSIDARTEKLLQQGLQRLLVGRTSFIIAHRLSTIKNCDKIMYIDNKGIAECGTHDQLIAKKGEYYKLYTAQHMD